jgi:hypothetical protein
MMEHKFQQYLYDSFSKLVEKHELIKSTEINEEGAYSIKYRSDAFVINLEKYYREFYVTLYKTDNPDEGVNLFNLLDFLNIISLNAPKSRFFEEEKDLDECYKKQFNYIADTIDENFAALNVFFKSENYELKMAEIERFMLNKYPKTFKRD